MKPLVIYHADCADGFGAAFAAWMKFGDEATYIPMQYGHDPIYPEFGLNKVVYILDFSLPKPQMEHLLKIADRVVWLDHHKTAFEMWCGGIPECGYYDDRDTSPDWTIDHVTILSNNKSGAMIAWEFFHPGTEVPKLIQHIDDRDRWRFKMEGTKELNAALWSYAPWSFEQWWRLFYDKTDATDKRTDLIQEGRAILRAHNQHVQSSVKKATKCAIRSNSPFANAPGSVIDGFVRYEVSGLAVNCPAHLASDVGHELANKSGTFGLCWYLDETLTVRCSLRSNGDYDVSAIAKHFGGGGHQNAAGFSTNIETLMGWLK